MSTTGATGSSQSVLQDIQFRLARLEARVFPVRAVSPEAQAIYAAYPLKVGKPAALRAIQRVLNGGMDAGKLLATTKQYAEARRGFREFIPNPATWFNQCRYEDSQETWVPARAISPLAYQSAKREVARLREEYRMADDADQTDISQQITQHNKTINDYERQN